MRSLRIRLILLLGIAIVVAAVTLFLTTFQAAQKSSDRLFDYHMQQMALTIQNTGLEESPWDPFLYSEENNFDFVIQIWSKEGAKLYQSRTYRFLPKRAAIGFSTVTLDNGDWRVYAVQNDEQVIQVAQKMTARRESGISFALRTLWPVVPVTVLLLAVAWWVVTTALRPLEKVSRQLSERNADSRTPINVEGLPTEVMPLISELNSLLSRMTLTLQAQQQFIADAAHELRSPITSLKLQIHSLTKAKDDTARGRAIGRLLKGIERSSHMVEQLLALARNEPFSQPFRPQAISLDEVIKPAVDEVEPLAMSRGITMEHRQIGDPSVFGEKEALQIAVRNLLDNAIRYIPDNGHIAIRSEAKESGVVLCIEDTGTGIPLSDRGRVFDRFYRVPGTEQTGTGLGLAIVKAIADRHDAKIELMDSRIGGLAVQITFPADKALLPQNLKVAAPVI